MEIEPVDSVESQRKIYYSAGGAFRIIGGEDEGLYFKHSDHLGSTSVISDSTGAKVADSDVLYAPFGEIRTGTLSELTDFGFTGQIVDRSSGDLMYYGARYYLPSLKRFISADTITPSVLNGQALNRYSYTKNNPINSIDPSGHCAPDEMGCWIEEYIKQVEAGLINPGSSDDGGGGDNSLDPADLSNDQLIEALDYMGWHFKDVYVEEPTKDELLIALDAVVKMTVSIAQNVEDRPDTYQETFQQVYGDNHEITLYNGQPSICKGDPNCNITSYQYEEDGTRTLLSGGLYTDINANIHIDRRLLSVELLIHEFSHIFTGPTINGVATFNGEVLELEDKDIFNFASLWDSVGDAAAYFTNELVGEYHISPYSDPAGVGEVAPKASEVTADAITSWILGVHDNGDYLDTFMDNLIAARMAGIGD